MKTIRHLVVLIGVLCCMPGWAWGSSSYSPDTTPEPFVGVQRLREKPQQAINSLVNQGIWPLLQPHILEAYLGDLEGTKPNWDKLQDQEGEEHGERLFSFNRQRDQTREAHALLQQPIAFLWAGMLRRYQEKYAGFTVAIGPEYIPTSWGIVRFTPMGLPDNMIVLPSPALRTAYRKQIQKGKDIEVGILFIGRLVPDESIMYAFSHDEPSAGMIMPVVHIERVQYFVKPTH